MNTSPVSNLASLLQAAASPAGKQDMGSSADAASFNQVLSREISSQDGNAPTQANAAGSSNAAKPVQKDAGAKEDGTQNNAGDQDAATTETGAKATDDKVAASKDGKDVKKDDDKDDSKTEASDPSGLAAFVAALTSAKATPTDTAARAAATAAQGEDDATGKKPDILSALGKNKPGADADAKHAPAAAKDASTAANDAELRLATVKAGPMLDAGSANANAPQTFAATFAAAISQTADAQNNARSNELLPPVGAAGWDDALGQKVVWMAKGMEQTATLTLNPPDLGPMQVTVNVTNNQATATFIAHQPEVRHALEASMPRLRDMLNDAGIQLGQSSVNAGMPNQQGGFDEARQSGNGRRSSGGTELADTTVHVTHVPTPRGGNGMVDTFA